MKTWQPALIILALLVGLFCSASAEAHFNLNLNVRILHVVHGEHGLDLYLRTPMPYLVAGRIGSVGPDGLPAPAPFTTNRLEDGAAMHLIAPAAVRADPLGLGALAAEDLHIETGGVRLAAEVVAVRVHPLGREPGFATRAEAAAALAGGPVFPADAGETYVGDAVADIHLRLVADATVAAYALSMSADPGLPGQEETANLVLDYRGAATRTYRMTGLMATPVVVSGSPVSAASTFVIEGIHHILEGLDHVLFILCLILGATALGSLLARVTGFTLGHTVTLILGFFGLAPEGSWFIPLVETAIALSIILAAANAVLRWDAGRGQMCVVAVTAGIGLLHGFGFSFMLHNILQVDAPNVWQSLLAFNLGVEFGQLLIILAAWPLVLLLRALREPTWRIASTGAALVASVIAAVWVVQRAGAILA